MDSPRAGRPPGHPQPAAGHTAGAPAPDPGYVHWTYLGAESVFFYPPGSAREHLVVDHGIPSVTMHWQLKGRLYDHAGDHLKQPGVRSGALGDLIAVTHTHEPPAAHQ
jgi:hypothetical protein